MFDDVRSDFFLLMCSIAQEAVEQLKMSLSRVKVEKLWKLMKMWVLSDMTVATERSRRDLSIGEVKF